jgi:hypothetical protein
MKRTEQTESEKTVTVPHIVVIMCLFLQARSVHNFGNGGTVYERILEIDKRYGRGYMGNGRKGSQKHSKQQGPEKYRERSKSEKYRELQRKP